MSKNMLIKSISIRRNLFLSSASLAAGVLWLSSCAAPPENATLNNGATNNGATNKATDTAVGNGSTPVKSIAPTVTPKAKGFSYRIFVPNADAKLSPQIVRDTSVGLPTNYEGKAKRVLKLLFPRLKFLPQGTRLLEDPYTEENGVLRLNLSRQFLQLDKLPETPVALTLDAISKTLGAFAIENGKMGGAAKVRFWVEGKKVRILSEFSLEEPWQASDQFESDAAKPGGGV